MDFITPEDRVTKVKEAGRELARAGKLGVALFLLFTILGFVVRLRQAWLFGAVLGFGLTVGFVLGRIWPR